MSMVGPVAIGAGLFITITASGNGSDNTGTAKTGSNMALMGGIMLAVGGGMALSSPSAAMPLLMVGGVFSFMGIASGGLT